jgi:hypothetical protein
VTPRPRLLSLAVLGLAIWAAPAAAQEKEAAKARLTDRLARKVTLDKFEGTFKQAVELFATKFDLPLVLDPSVRPEGAADDTPVNDTPVRLPPLVNVRVATALRILCEQVNAMYLVRPDHIKIVGAAHGLYETGVLKQPDPTSPDEEPSMLSSLEMQKAKPLIKRALVTAGYKGTPLSEVLDDIAESTGATVVLSPEVGPKATAGVTARFANTPVDAAVRTLCEVADLGVIEDANVLVVTTREKAAARAKAEDEKRKTRHPAGMIGFPGFAGLGGWLGGLGGPAVPTDMAAELAKLKEQNEQLKKQVEELQKALKK